MTTLICDIETDGLMPNVNRLWCLGIKELGEKKGTAYANHPNYPSISEGIERIKKAEKVVFHNGLAFDVPALQLLGFDVSHENVIDTLVMSRLYHPDREDGHSLKAWGIFFGNHKGDWNDWSGFSDGMAEYMLQDLEVTEQLYLYLTKRMKDWGESIELEHKVAWIIQKQVQNGFCFNETKARKLAGQLMAEIKGMDWELKEQFPPIYVQDGKTVKVSKTRRVKSKQFTKRGTIKKKGVTIECDVPVMTLYEEGSEYCKIKIQEFNPGSRHQIADRLFRKYGWKSPEVTEKGHPKIDEKTLGDLDVPEARVMIKYLTLNKKLSMLDGEPKKDGSGGGWLHHIRNGRIHGDVNPNGANTGRMTHSKPNVAQADSDPRMRELFESRPGWKLTGCDAEGLELRMLGHYLARYDGGRFSRAVVSGSKEDGTDAHTINKKLVGLYSRDFAKTFIYALIYGGGDFKLGLIIMEDAMAAGQPKPKGKLAKHGSIARKKIEEGLGLGKLVEKVKFKGKKDGHIRGLDGRKLRIRSLHSALNTLLQGAGAIVMKKALVLFDEKATEMFGEHGVRWAYCANVHDEVQVECEPEIAEDLGKLFADCIRLAGEHFELRCPLAGAYDVGENWSQTH